MTNIEKLRTLARELAAQAHVRREAAKALMTQADLIQS